MAKLFHQPPPTPCRWHSAVGYQRNWVWRGWNIRYSYIRAHSPQQSPTPLLLLHGFGAAIGHWRHNIPAFSHYHTVYAMDLLGFGASQKTVTTFNTDLWSAQVFEFWQTFIQCPMVLMGNSLGSLVSVAATVAHPEMVAGLIMVNLPDASVLPLPLPSPILRFIKPVVNLIKPAIALLNHILLSPPIFDPFFNFIRQPTLIRYWATFAYANPNRVDHELVHILCSPAYEKGASRTLAHMTRSPGGNPDYAAKVALPQLQIPMLLIWGKQDRLVPPVLAPMLASLNPSLQWVELDQAGHCPQDECPEIVNPLVLDWIRLQVGR